MLLLAACKLLFPRLPVSGTNPPDCISLRPLSTGTHPANWGIVMRVLLLRIGALGVVVVLGWIAIAHAQRGSDDTGLPPADSAGSVNPLRASSPPPAHPYPSAAEPAARRPAADPFAAQARPSGTAAVVPASAPPAGNSIPDASSLGLSSSRNNALRSQRYASAAVPVSAEQPAAGPALTPNGSTRPADDRRAAGADRNANRSGSGRNAAPPVADSQEPAPFKADPFAMPANPPRAANVAHGSFSAPADSSRPAEVAAEGEGTGQPGARQLDGVQSPQLSIQKLAPKEIQVGKPASFRVTVHNTGPTAAYEVEVRDAVPKGTRLVGTTPQASRGTRGEVIWTLGTIPPGEQRTVDMQLMPTAEGEIGSVATVHFRADACARTIATRPQLVVAATGPQKVLIGDQAVLTITVSNPGTGAATGVVLEERIPPGLQHPAGTELEYEVGDLRPGESRKLELPLLANRPGTATNLLSARGDGNLRAENKLDFEVLAPQLNVVLEGPKRRYLERQATYQLSVTNPGTAPAKQVELVANLPPGLKFISANNAGYYEESSRSVRWRLEELPANETGSVELVTMPIQAGQQAIRLRGTAQKGLAVEKEQPVVIEGIAAILFQVADTVDPLEVGGETTYEVHVVNQGSKAAANVRLTILLPPELKPVTAEGPTRHSLGDNRVSFDGLAMLAPKAETNYRLRVKALKAGDLRASFQLLTDDMQSPVSKEESTRVYADE
jgi:uncharacterized repeat protein (TIGR01451 family)